jgi:KaiC/GvpD/RAD55 family RecA-like ATPase
MVAAANIKSTEELAQDALDDARADGVVSAFRTLLSGLSPEIQERVRESLLNSFSQTSTARPREVLATVLRLVPRDRAITIEEVQKSVEAEGIQATAKVIANALGYLTRKKKIVRVGHGRYMVDNEMVITSDNLGGAPSRHEEDDT